MADGSGEIDIKALPKMVRWYSPAHLVSTGWRSIVSELFGQYADQRIMQATIDGFAPEIMKTVVGRYNYSDLRQLGDGDTVWVDYVADLGDGFDSTYAMASLISQPQIDLEGVGALPAAKLLIMGGDQVYPFPTRTAYRERFAMPYSTALPPAPDGNWRRLLFVLPGNHDWYDGLSSFDTCSARRASATPRRTASAAGFARSIAAISRSACRTTGGSGAPTSSSRSISMPGRCSTSRASPRR